MNKQNKIHRSGHRAAVPKLGCIYGVYLAPWLDFQHQGGLLKKCHRVCVQVPEARDIVMCGRYHCLYCGGSDRSVLASCHYQFLESRKFPNLSLFALLDSHISTASEASGRVLFLWAHDSFKYISEIQRKYYISGKGDIFVIDRGNIYFCIGSMLDRSIIVSRLRKRPDTARAM